MESWKRIDERYEVSDKGNVRSTDRIVKAGNGQRRLKGRILKPQYIGKYLAVYLYDLDAKKQVWKYIHRLVAEAFIPNPDNLPQVNHKDENPSNNCIDNLEWCTQIYNLNYGTVRERIRQSMIESGRWEDYSDMSEEEKEKKKKDKYRKSYLKHYHASKRGRYTSLKGLTEEEKIEWEKRRRAEWFKKRYVPIKHPVIVYQLVPQLVQEFDSAVSAAEYLGTNKSNLYYHINDDSRPIKTDKGLFIIKQ